jgi:hypothetical protein
MKSLRKINSILLILIVALSAAGPVGAQSPTVSETVNEKLNSQINELKDKIASRVSELNLVERRGITGEVVEASTSQITLKDISGNTRLIDIDEITKFSSSSNSNFGVSDLEEGDRLNVLGLYNKQSKRLLARFVSTAVNPVFLSGAISAIDEDEFTIELTSETNKKTTIDVVTSTRTNEYDDEGEPTKSGFSKLEISDRIIVIGLPDKDDSSLVVAERVLVFTALSKNPGIDITSSSTGSPTTTTKPSPTVSR